MQHVLTIHTCAPTKTRVASKPQVACTLLPIGRAGAICRLPCPRNMKPIQPLLDACQRRR